MTTFQSDLIFDVGMHVGEDSEFYLKKGFRVVAIEANPELCRQTGERLQAYCSSGQLIIINAAIVEHSGPAIFYVNERASEWGTANPSWAQRNLKMGVSSHPITVDGLRMPELFATYGMPYFLKIDIEGNDLLCLEALIGATQKPRYISIESSKTSFRDLLEEFRLLSQLGYTGYKVVNQLHIPAQICPNPPGEGVFVEHLFPRGATGLFGNEVPGRWMPMSLAIMRYVPVFAKYALFGNKGIFTNLHRRLPNWPRLRRLVDPGWYDTHACRDCD